MPDDETPSTGNPTSEPDADVAGAYLELPEPTQPSTPKQPASLGGTNFQVEAPFEEALPDNASPETSPEPPPDAAEPCLLYTSPSPRD